MPTAGAGAVPLLPPADKIRSSNSLDSDASLLLLLLFTSLLLITHHLPWLLGAGLLQQGQKGPQPPGAAGVVGGAREPCCRSSLNSLARAGEWKSGL